VNERREKVQEKWVLFSCCVDPFELVEILDFVLLS